MANNRMYLMHMPSRVGVYLGKRMAKGWYDAPTMESIRDFYDYIEEFHPDTQNQLTLAFEDHPFQVDNSRTDIVFLSEAIAMRKVVDRG